MLDASDLGRLGLASVGRDVCVSPKVSFYGPERIHLGDRVRIDDFCILSAGAGGIRLGRNVHVACYASLIGNAEIRVEDFAGISARAAVYSSNDDYSGAHLTGPTVPAAYRAVHEGPVTIGRHVVVGAGAIVLPGVSIGEGAAIGALSLVKNHVAPFQIHGGVPARRIGERARDMLELERRYREEEP